MVDAAVLGPIGELKAHAVAYAESGLEVFPLNADKTPRTANGFKDASSNPLVVAGWWDVWPDSLIGCRVPADLVVIDVDPKHNGMSTWKLLKETFGELPATRAHKSGRNDGGGHLWFRRPEQNLSIRPMNAWAKEHGTGESAGKQKWTAGVDLLHHDFRYTILPPSPHPTTGAPYRWVDGRDLNTEPAELPSWLIVLVTEEPEPIKAKEVGPVAEDSIADWYSATQSWVDILEDWTLVSGDGDEDGSEWRHPEATTSRSATVTNGCLFVYSTSTDFEVTSDGDPHGYTPFAAYALLHHNGDQSAAARAARQLHDEDWSFTGLDPAVYTCPPFISTSVDVSAEPTAEDRHPALIDWAKLWSEEDAELSEWLIEPIIARGRQAVIWANAKTGKSLVALEMAAAAATGRECLGKEARPPIRIMYVDLEMTKADVRERLEDMGYDGSPETEKLFRVNLLYYLLPDFPPLDTPAGGAALYAEVKKYQPDLVFFDTMARVVAGDENSADTYRAYYRCTGLHLKAFGVAVVRLDHSGKNELLGQRGSSAKGDDVDVVWQLKTTDSGLQFKLSAGRMSWLPAEVNLTRHEDPVLRHVITTGSWPPGTGALAEQLDRLGVGLTAPRRLVREALKRAGIQCRNEILSAALRYRKDEMKNFKGLK